MLEVPVRKELIALEHAEQLARRKELYLAKYPITGHGKAPGKAGGGKKKPEAKENIVSSFADDTAAKTGVAARSVRRAVQVATAIPADLRERLRGTPVEDKELLRLAYATH